MIRRKTLWLLAAIIIAGCNKKELNSLNVSPGNIEFDKEGSYTNLIIQTDADSWSIDNPASDWLIISSTSGTQKNALVTVGVSTKTLEPRSATLTVHAGNADPVEVNVSQPSSDFLYSFTSIITELSFQRSGNLNSISFTTDAPEWNIVSDVNWLQFSQITGNSGTISLQVTASENEGIDPRYATITLTAEYTQDFQIPVTQNGEIYLGYNISPLPPDASEMSSLATEIAANINLGWNAGNSLEAIGGQTAWGNPLISQALIQLVKQNGFNAIRLPCSFNQYMENSATAELKTDWLNRVKDVIQYCVDADMYVILNIHWDSGWLENNCTTNKQEVVNAKQKAFWEQIATHLRDFDKHLLFASANEPNVSNADQMNVLKSYHQTFINAVRSTGGRNAYRVLVIQGPSTDIEKTNQLMTSLPFDSIPGRMMAEIHYYTPWNFCGLEQDASWGSMFYYWGKDYHSTTDPDRNASWGEEDLVDELFAKMKKQFVNQGIPVVMGEFSAIRRSNLTGENLEKHLASRAYYYYYVTKQAKANGLIPFYWDNGYTGNNGSAIFNRNTNTVFDQQALDALIEGSIE